MWQQAEVLKDHPDAETPRFGRIVDLDRPALPDDAPFVGLERAVEHLHQRGLAGAVLAKQRMHRAGEDFQADLITCGERPEALGQPLRYQERRIGLRRP